MAKTRFAESLKIVNRFGRKRVVIGYRTFPPSMGGDTVELDFTPPAWMMMR